MKYFEGCARNVELHYSMEDFLMLGVLGLQGLSLVLDLELFEGPNLSDFQAVLAEGQKTLVSAVELHPNVVLVDPSCEVHSVLLKQRLVTHILDD